MRQARAARLAPAVTLAMLALAGCGGDQPTGAVVPAADGPDPTVSESPVAASAIMSCDTIATEHAAIAQSLQRLDASNAADDLRKRDAALARLAAQKGCRGF
jgi:hypothetical protein